MTLAALLELQARDPTLIEQRLLAAEIEEVLSDEREWGANPIAVLRMRSRAGALRAHFKHTTPLRPAAALLVRGFGHTQQEALMNECVAWHLARCMGPRYAALLAPTVWRTGVPVGTGASALSLHLAGAPALTVTDPAQVDAAALFDSISWQQDRHCDNYLWDPARRRLALIDHSFSLPASRPEPAGSRRRVLPQRAVVARPRAAHRRRAGVAHSPAADSRPPRRCARPRPLRRAPRTRRRDAGQQPGRAASHPGPGARRSAPTTPRAQASPRSSPESARLALGTAHLSCGVTNPAAARRVAAWERHRPVRTRRTVTHTTDSIRTYVRTGR